MILDETIFIGLSGNNLNHYEEKGYEIPRRNDNRNRFTYPKGSKIEVKVCDLQITSKIKINVKCENCLKDRKVFYDSLMNRKDSQYLVTGETLCTKCRNKRLFAGETGIGYKHGSDRYCEYRLGAKTRNLIFQLTPDEFKNIVKQKCHYCGGFSIDSNPKSRGNGIDRKNNNIGYVIENCVSCCVNCNYMKKAMPYNDYIKHIRRSYKHTKNYEI